VTKEELLGDIDDNTLIITTSSELLAPGVRQIRIKAVVIIAVVAFSVQSATSRHLRYTHDLLHMPLV